MAETYYSLTDIVKLCDNLVAAMPTSFFNGIWKVRNTLYRIPAADVVARDCYDRLLAENDKLRKERPVRHGRWVLTTQPLGWRDEDCVECSECGEDFILDEWGIDDVKDAMRYCPSCGALMDKDGDGDGC